MWFRKNSETKNAPSDETREKSLRVRQLNADIKREKDRAEIQRIKLEAQLANAQLERELLEIQSEIDELTTPDEEGDAPSGMNDVMSMMAMKFIQGQQGAQATAQPSLYGQGVTVPQEATPEGTVEISDETIDFMLEKLPKKYLKMAKSAPDAVVRDYVKMNFPQAGEESVKRAMEKLKSK